MKRSRSAVAALPGVMKLNVGGQHFETSSDSLRKANYFEPIIEGRLTHGLDDDGRLFIDRNGTLFSHILEFMRTGLRPTEDVLAEHRDALAEECNFFGLDSNR